MKNKSILVTGGLGFIGSHFVEYLLEVCDKCNIYIIDKYTYCVSPRTEILLKDKSLKSTNRLAIMKGDISSSNKKDYAKIFNMDYVVNFAAESHVDNSIISGRNFVESNVNGCYNLLEYYSSPCTKFIQISTDEVYGSVDKGKVSYETDVLNPSSVYSSSKASADLIALSHYKTHGQNVVICRSCNNFGPRQYKEKFIPTIISNALRKNKIPIYGDGKNRRQWIYVRDNCRYIYHLMEYGKAGEIYNIVPRYKENIYNLYSNLDIVFKIVNDIIGLDISNIIKFVKDRKGHDRGYCMNGDKLNNLLLKRPIQEELNFDSSNHLLTFQEHLKMTVDWYKSNYNKNIDYWRKL